MNAKVYQCSIASEIFYRLVKIFFYKLSVKMLSIEDGALNINFFKKYLLLNFVQARFLILKLRWLVAKIMKIV